MLEKAARILSLRGFPLQLRCQLVALPLLFKLSGIPTWQRLLKAYTTRRADAAGPRERQVRLDGVDLYVTSNGSLADVGALYEIFVSEDYRSDYQDAVVVDLGAHKGYYGAYAIVNGASAVASFEPESSNFRLLQSAANSLEQSRSAKWQTSKAAVGASDGQAILHVSGDSWTHSFIERPGQSIGAETVEIVPMSRVLEEARALGPGRIVVKMDVEGAECEILRETPLDCWSEVDELFVEVHGFSSCSASDIVGHLGRAGLTAESALPGEEEGPHEFVHSVLHFRRP
jgi:FkbM family methyltransferase